MLEFSLCSNCLNLYKFNKYAYTRTCSVRCSIKVRDKKLKKYYQNQINERTYVYNLNPNSCKQCLKIFPYEKRHLKFCDNVCSAKFNNSNRILAVIDKPKKNNKSTVSATKLKNLKIKIIKNIPEITGISLYPIKKVSVIKHTAQYMNKSIDSITHDDVADFKEHLEYLLNIENLSPFAIGKKLNSDLNRFDMFLKACMGIKIKSPKDAINNYHKQHGRCLTDEREIYWKQCRFNFNVFDYPKIPNYDLIATIPFYHSKNNPTGLNRDHMVSISYGWENKVDPKIISHPANCAILSARDNFSKNSTCSITLEQLLERIKLWNTDDNIISFKKEKRNHTEQQKQNLSIKAKELQIYTNGVENIKQNKSLPIPDGFRKGLTFKKKRRKKV